MSSIMPIDLAGTLLVDLGKSCPNNLISTRKDWASVMTRGLPANLLSQRLGAIYSLCGQAHRICSDMAIATARERDSSLAMLSKNKLKTETIREHIHRITLNWPNLLPKSDFQNILCQQAQSSLLSCPVLQSHYSEVTHEAVCSSHLIDWIEVNLLNMPASEWLKNWEKAPENWLNHWLKSKENWLSTVIQEFKNGLTIFPISTPKVNSLKIHTNDSDLLALAKKLSEESNFNLFPQWRDACAETGTWTRLNDVTSSGVMSYVLRFAYRIADLVRLVLPDSQRYSGSEWLNMGSISTGPCEALAWVEMARGLLIHHVQLNTIREDARVVSCQTIAPTEWNFHPNGAVAHAIESMINLGDLQSAQNINVLMAAYDPCINFKIVESQVKTAQKFSQEESHNA